MDWNSLVVDMVGKDGYFSTHELNLYGKRIGLGHIIYLRLIIVTKLGMGCQL